MHDHKLGWVHYNCVNWIEEIWFRDESKTVIDGIVNYSRFGLGCYICR